MIEVITKNEPRCHDWGYHNKWSKITCLGLSPKNELRCHVWGCHQKELRWHVWGITRIWTKMPCLGLSPKMNQDTMFGVVTKKWTKMLWLGHMNFMVQLTITTQYCCNSSKRPVLKYMALKKSCHSFYCNFGFIRPPLNLVPTAKWNLDFLHYCHIFYVIV